MILKNRLFERREPSREAKSIFIFCEGVRREFHYFQYFKEIDSRINIEVYPLTSEDDNSPTGLYEKACLSIIKTEDNPSPKYQFIEGTDEVWFVIDIDMWGDKISRLREICKGHKDWSIAQSNPCFEVWLYYHFNNVTPEFEGCWTSSAWKDFINTVIVGGFDSRKHPIYVKTAIYNSEKNYIENGQMPNVGSTEVFKLAKVIYSLVGERIELALRAIGISE